MKLTKEEIKHIADLARLELTDDELKKYGSQLSAVLNYINQLKEVDTTDIEPTAQVTGLENALREDVKEDWDKREGQEAFRQAPELESGQIKVKRVL
ncbi:MAG: Asp-tRNA(Asn)/Glu-tRNA(Gln) amidotransferase subunit GatC [Patescibacteria group bacterium]|nr:Asp-tRNA(Asn)/Glu-tRNA(Gln) amidotransferase subunit GatC [Patescibacteria group bacterium]MDD5295200.1 Asp-tRNA(Asn)/Glu-tRNA(Gln) amidotransferase subunit GatC [Patescibacteria group bacterium]MDD5554465.1 Asp-tRNA(Asn)/Glu-tRNA(Gln) amidotransferase subunit GatC [Patescibacteria group bacterium]